MKIITDKMIRAAAQCLHERLSARIAAPKRKAWDNLRPSIRKQYLDIAYAMLVSARQ